MEAVRPVPGGSELEVWVVPGASRAGVVGLHDGRVRVRVTAPAAEDRANRAVERLLQSILGHSVRVVQGRRRRHKLVRVDGASPAQVWRALGV